MNPSPIAFTVAGFSVRWYGLMIALGIALGIGLAMARERRYGLPRDTVVDLALCGVPAAIVGARLYYVIFSWPTYAKNPISALYLWEGGLAIYGGILGGLLAGLLYARKKGLRFLTLADLVAPCFAIGQAVGRWGNFMNREAFGTETTLPWRMQLTTVSGALVEVHPTFLYESLWNVIGLILIAAVVSKARRFDGENTWFYFLWYGFGRFWIEGLRTDSLYFFRWTLLGQPIRVSQALSAVMELVSLFMLFYHIKLHPHKPEELYVNIAAARDAAAPAAAEDAPQSEEESR